MDSFFSAPGAAIAVGGSAGLLGTDQGREGEVGTDRSQLEATAGRLFWRVQDLGPVLHRRRPGQGPTSGVLWRLTEAAEETRRSQPHLAVSGVSYTTLDHARAECLSKRYVLRDFVLPRNC